MPTASVAVAGFPAEVITNATVVGVPFTVQVAATGLVCIGINTVPLTATLTATVTGNNSTAMKATVVPSSMTFRTNSIVLGTVPAETRDAVVIVKIGDYLMHENTVKVTATLATSQGCTPLGSPASTDEKSFIADFKPLGPAPTPGPSEKMPGPEFVVLAGAVLAVALLRRRQA
jgi:hypothetical protein